MAPGIRSPLKEVGLLGMIFGWMMRRFSNLAIGAGVPELGAGRSRWKSIPGSAMCASSTFTPASLSARSRRPRSARSQAAGAGHPGHRLRASMKRAKSIPHRRYPQRRDGGLPHSRHRGHARRSTCISTKAVSITCSAAASASARSQPCRRRRRSPTPSRNATGIRLTELPIRPDRLDRRTAKGGPPHDTDQP